MGWTVPVSVKDAFVDFCTSRGARIQEDAAGALVIWKYLPAQIREWARLEAKGTPAVDRQFWESFARSLELALQVRLTNLLSSQDQLPADKAADPKPPYHAKKIPKEP